MTTSRVLAALLVLSAACSSESVKPAASAATSPPTSTTTTAAAATEPQSEPWPTSMVVLGHSGATGWNSDPGNPGADAPENSWATGTNPDVNSIYLRALAQSPELRDRNFNVARSGSDVNDLPRQVTLALSLQPLPDLFIIQSIDNDVRCDGTDDENYEQYGEAMASIIAVLADGAPAARIFVVGMWATVENYADVTSAIPYAVSGNQGGGPCDVFDASGEKIPAAIATYQDVVDRYQSQLEQGCAAVPACTYGGGAIRNMVIDADDLTDDTYHLSIQGQAKMADAAWAHLSR